MIMLHCYDEAQLSHEETARSLARFFHDFTSAWLSEDRQGGWEASLLFRDVIALSVTLPNPARIIHRPSLSKPKPNPRHDLFHLSHTLFGCRMYCLTTKGSEKSESKKTRT